MKTTALVACFLPAFASAAAPPAGGAPRKLKTLKGHDNFVTALAFDGAGKTLASASTDGTIRLWNAETGKAGATVKLDAGDLAGAIALSPDGKIVAAAVDATVRTFAADGKPLWSHKVGGAVKAMRFSGDGGVLVVAADASVVLSSASGDEAQKLPGKGVVALAISPAGSTVFALSGDALSLISRGTGQVDKSHPVGGSSLALSPDGKLAIVHGGDEVRAVDVDTGAEAWSKPGVAADSSVGVAGDVALAVTGAKRLSAWSLAKGDDKWWIDASEDVQVFAVAPGGKLIASGGEGNTIVLWGWK